MVVSQSPYDVHEFIHSTRNFVCFVPQIGWILFRSEFVVHATWSAADVILGSPHSTAATFKKYQSVAIVASARPLVTSDAECLIDRLAISNVKLYMKDNFTFRNCITSIKTYQSCVAIFTDRISAMTQFLRDWWYFMFNFCQNIITKLYIPLLMY